MNVKNNKISGFNEILFLNSKYILILWYYNMILQWYYEMII